MKVSIGPRGILQIDDSRIIFRNFSGAPSQYNREGDRNFAVVIPDNETAEMLQGEGWNVRIKPPRNDGDDPFMYLPVKVKFNDYGPTIIMQTGDSKNYLNEDSVHRLDQVDIISVDMDLRPYDWEVNGNTGRSAYLQKLWVRQNLDRFEKRMTEEYYPGDEYAEQEDLPFA